MPESVAAQKIAENRLKKATAIAELLSRHGYRSGQVAIFTDEQWRYAADASRQNKPSAESQAIVIKMLEQWEMMKSNQKEQNGNT